MFADPSPTPYDVRFSLAGIPVRVNPYFWAMALVLGFNLAQHPRLMLIWIGVVFVSILVHEMGHALAARSFGLDPWITLWGFGGLCSYNPGRYDPNRQIMISFAGPAAGFAFAGLVVLLLTVTNRSFQFFEWTLGRGDPIDNFYIWYLVSFLLFVNVFWGIVNLFPVLPLDGGQVARDLLAQLNPHGSPATIYMLSTFTGAALAAGGLILFGSVFLALMFGFMAYNSFTAWQAYSGGGRGW